MPEPNHNTSRIGGAQPVPDGHSTRTTHGDPGVPETLPSLTWRSVSALAVVTVVLFAGLFLLGWIPEARRRAEAAAIAGESISSKPLVDVVTPRPGPAPELLLPGDLRPNQSTAIQARATGYLKPLPPGIDIGARVKAGQVIAEIDAPDIDAELAQAKASLEQTRATAIRAKADFEYSRSTVERYEAAARDNAVARQDLEDKRNQQAQNEAAMKVAEANIEAAKANVLRLTELQNFKTVTAPFSGIITARGYDAGALITASDASAGRELFHLDETDILRASVNVPQGFVSQLQPGQGVDLLVRNLPGKVFAGKLARLSGAIDPAARTMRVEIDVPNPDGVLVPGMYTQVRFHLDPGHRPSVVPTSTLTFNADGMRVAVVESGKVRFQKVTLGRDFGSEVEIIEGLNGDEQLVNNPSDNLADGDMVAVRPPKPQVK